MADDKEKSDLASGARVILSAYLREQCTWLKTETREGFLDKTAGDLDRLLHEQHEVMEASKSRMGLMKIPRELRDQIYELALPNDENNGEHEDHDEDEEPDRNEDEDEDENVERVIEIDVKLRFPSLLHVSRQVREEAAPLYYGQHTFGITLLGIMGTFLSDMKFDLLECWLKAIGLKQAQMVKGITIEFLVNDPDRDLCLWRRQSGRLELRAWKVPRGNKTIPKSLFDCHFDPSGVAMEKWKVCVTDRNGAVRVTGVEGPA